MTDPIRRQSLAGVALICRRNRGAIEWMARWNRNWKCYYFVGGHKHDDESFLDCVVREIHEELAIERDKDYTVAEQPIARVQYTAKSRSAKVRAELSTAGGDTSAETDYTVEVYDVRLGADAARGFVRSQQVVRWLTADEIRSKFCTDGLPVSETMQRLLDRLEWICPPCGGGASPAARRG